MVKSIKNLQEYRRQYYRKNKDYLLSYQKWYYSNRRYQLGIIEKSEVFPKPNRGETFSEKKKKEEKLMKKTYGSFTIHFE